MNNYSWQKPFKTKDEVKKWCMDNQPYYKNLGFKQGYCREAEQYYAEAISLPIYPNLTETQQNTVVSVLKKAI